MKTDTREGFIVTYFDHSPDGFNLLKQNLEILSTENYYLILASHSLVPKEIQDLCDFYFYQKQNIVDDRKYSHGVAESNLIEIALKHLKTQGIEWTYKICYDIQINDVNVFKEWEKKTPNHKLVTCQWGDCYISTHSFYGEVKFLLDNIVFYKDIDSMFKVSNIIEKCWESNIENMKSRPWVYTYPSKEEFYGANKMDILYYNYGEVEFEFNPEENRFYVTNRGESFICSLSIFDYYTDLKIYGSHGFNLSKGGSYWIVPPFVQSVSESKNGFYLEIYLGDKVIRRNILIKDFNYKDSLSKKFAKFKHLEDCKFREYTELDSLEIYKNFNLDLSKMRNFVDVGANYGMASNYFVKRGIKSYLIDADQNVLNTLNQIHGKNGLVKVLDFAITDKDGDIEFYQDRFFSVVSSVFEIDANQNNADRTLIKAKSITPNTLIENYVEEDFIDLIKIDIEGSEYDFFNSITDLNIQKINNFIIEFHNNENYRVMDILVKLTKNGFNFKLETWGDFTNPFIIGNKMGIIYAWK